MELERTHTHTHNTTLLCVSVLLESTGQVYGVSGRLLRLWVALIALVPLRPQHAKDNDTSPVQGLISGQHEIIQQFSCQDLGRIKIHPQLIGWAHHQTYNTGLIADSTVLPTLALYWHTTMPGYTFGWMSPPFLSHLSPLDLPQLAPFPPTFPLCSLCPPPPPKPPFFFAFYPPSFSSDPQGQIFIAFLRVLWGEPWGSQWDQFKKEALVSPPLLGPLGWLGPLARNLQAFDLNHPPSLHSPTRARSFCWSLALKKKKNLFHFLRNVGPIPFLCTCERASVSFVNPLGGTNNLWRDWLLFEDVRAVRVFRWRHTERGLVVLGQHAWTTGEKLLGGSIHYSHSVGNGSLCYKEEKGTRWCLGAFPCWAVLKVHPPLYDIKEQWPCSKRETTLDYITADRWVLCPWFYVASYSYFLLFKGIIPISYDDIILNRACNLALTHLL